VGGLIRHPVSAVATTQDEADADGADEVRDDDQGAESEAAAPQGTRVAALVLAAGRSSRMGVENKLLMPVDGVPMALRAVMAARASRACALTVVLGHEAGEVE